MVECHDVVIWLDGISSEFTVETLLRTIDASNVGNGGLPTIIFTALIDTGSKWMRELVLLESYLSWPLTFYPVKEDLLMDKEELSSRLDLT